MENWLKVLVAVTCVAAIAWIGNSFRAERAHAERVAAYQQERTMRATCVEVNKTYDYRAVADYCREMGYTD